MPERTPQPVLIHQAISVAATIIVGIAARFGANLSADQVTVVLLSLGPIFSMVAAWIAHAQVRPLTDVELKTEKLTALFAGIPANDVAKMLADVLPPATAEFLGKVVLPDPAPVTPAK